MQTKEIDYKHRQDQLAGYYVHSAEKRPGILLCHAWRGRDQFVCDKAKELAEWGYQTFALDIYGKGILGKNKEENEALMAPFMQDRKFLQERLLIALEMFANQPEVDRTRIAVLGFCFGGLCALDLARGGANIKSAVSMHGLFLPPEQLPKKEIHAKIIAFHGYDDPMVPPQQVINFANEMTQAKADWQLHIFGGTKHAFTNPAANDPGFGTVYSALAAKRAWRMTKDFLEETLRA